MTSSYSVKIEDLAEQVYNQLKQMILQNELKSGEKLGQEFLAKKLGVSRTPLLHALNRLQQEMLVEIIPRRGAFVRKITLEELKHIFDLRIRLEPLAARNAAEKVSSIETEELEDILMKFKKAVETSDIGSQRTWDYTFHYWLMNHCGNPYLPKMLSAVNLISICNVKGMVTDPKISYKNHELVVKAIKEHNPENAEIAMRMHLEATRSKIIDEISKDDCKEQAQL